MLVGAEPLDVVVDGAPPKKSGFSWAHWQMLLIFLSPSFAKGDVPLRSLLCVSLCQRRKWMGLT